MGFLFQETQERFRNSRGKRAISVRAIEVLLYYFSKQNFHRLSGNLPFKLIDSSPCFFSQFNIGEQVP